MIFAMKAAADITGTLLVPAIAALVLRRFYQDLAFAKPLFYGSLTLALVLSLIAVIRKVQRYGQAYQQLLNDDPGSLESRRPGR